ncbi:hypothetical protein D3C87_1113850 [compost metagenome]
MAKEPQELKWIESLFPEEGFRRKSMFGGFAYYIDDKIVMLIFESPGDYKYRNQTFKFEVWNGCMFPVEREHHEKALKQFPELVNHPVLPKWLYLPLHTEGFDELVSEIITQAVKPTGFWGSIPKGKAKKGKTPKLVAVEKISTKIDTRKPRMFSDEPVEQVLKTAQKISDLKNLGEVTERTFHRAGIKTAPQFINMGWKKALIKLVALDPKNRHTMFAYALIGALTNKEWNGLSEDEKQEAKDFTKSLAPVKKTAKKKTVKRKK